MDKICPSCLKKQPVFRECCVCDNRKYFSCGDDGLCCWNISPSPVDSNLWICYDCRPPNLFTVSPPNKENSPSPPPLEDFDIDIDEDEEELQFYDKSDLSPPREEEAEGSKTKRTPEESKTKRTLFQEDSVVASTSASPDVAESFNRMRLRDLDEIDGVARGGSARPMRNPREGDNSDDDSPPHQDEPMEQEEEEPPMHPGTTAGYQLLRQESDTDTSSSVDPPVSSTLVRCIDELGDIMNIPLKTLLEKIQGLPSHEQKEVWEIRNRGIRIQQNLQKFFEKQYKEKEREEAGASHQSNIEASDPWVRQDKTADPSKEQKDPWKPQKKIKDPSEEKQDPWEPQKKIKDPSEEKQDPWEPQKKIKDPSEEKQDPWEPEKKIDRSKEEQDDDMRRRNQRLVANKEPVAGPSQDPRRGQYIRQRLEAVGTSEEQSSFDSNDGSKDYPPVGDLAGNLAYGPLDNQYFLNQHDKSDSMATNYDSCASNVAERCEINANNLPGSDDTAPSVFSEPSGSDRPQILVESAAPSGEEQPSEQGSSSGDDPVKRIPTPEKIRPPGESGEDSNLLRSRSSDNSTLDSVPSPWVSAEGKNLLADNSGGSEAEQDNSGGPKAVSMEIYATISLGPPPNDPNSSGNDNWMTPSRVSLGSTSEKDTDNITEHSTTTSEGLRRANELARDSSEAQPLILERPLLPPPPPSGRVKKELIDMDIGARPRPVVPPRSPTEPSGQQQGMETQDVDPEEDLMDLEPPEPEPSQINPDPIYVAQGAIPRRSSQEPPSQRPRMETETRSPREEGELLKTGTPVPPLLPAPPRSSRVNQSLMDLPIDAQPRPQSRVGSITSPQEQPQRPVPTRAQLTVPELKEFWENQSSGTSQTPPGDNGTTPPPPGDRGTTQPPAGGRGTTPTPAGGRGTTQTPPGGRGTTPRPPGGATGTRPTRPPRRN